MDYEKLIPYVFGVIASMFSIITSLILYIYHGKMKEIKADQEKKDKVDDKQWDAIKEETENIWHKVKAQKKDLDEEIDRLFQAIRVDMKEGIKEERLFRYEEMAQAKSDIRELFESRKEMCREITEVRGVAESLKIICNERHKGQ